MRKKARKSNKIEDEEAMLGDPSPSTADDAEDSPTTPEPAAPAPFDEDQVILIVDIAFGSNQLLQCCF